MVRLRRIFLDIGFTSWIHSPWLKKEIRTWRGNPSITMRFLRNTGSWCWRREGQLFIHLRKVVLLKVNWRCQDGRYMVINKIQYPMEFGNLKSGCMHWVIGNFVSRLSKGKLYLDRGQANTFLLACQFWLVTAPCSFVEKKASELSRKVEWLISDVFQGYRNRRVVASVPSLTILP